MSNESYTQFRAVNHYNEPLLTVELETNLKGWLDYGLLKIGAWENVTTGTVGIFGGSMSTLHVVDDPSYTDDTVYQGIRKDWIWETGINYSTPTGGSYDPLTVQVYKNGALINTGTVGATHYINYPEGKVVFDVAQTNDTITAQYSYRSVQVYISDDENCFFETQYDTHNPADVQWSQNLISGDYSLSSTNRIQLPAIVISPVVNTRSQPFELGTLTNKNKQDVLFHCIAESRYERNNLTDILRLQQGKTIVLYDSNLVDDADKWPLDYRGMVVSGAQTYAQIVSDPTYLFRTAFFEKINVSEVKTNHPKLHWSVVRMSIEIIF